jgi:hypothetical protein
MSVKKKNCSMHYMSFLGGMGHQSPTPVVIATYGGDVGFWGRMRTAGLYVTAACAKHVKLTVNRQAASRVNLM